VEPGTYTRATKVFKRDRAMISFGKYFALGKTKGSDVLARVLFNCLTKSCENCTLQDTCTSRDTEGAADFAVRRTPSSPTQARQVEGDVGHHAPRYNLSRGITMNSVPRDLRDALPDVDPEANQFSARSTRCLSCNSLPAPGSRLRYCGSCRSAAYCSKPCARADWDTHKLSCERLRQGRGESLAAFVAGGGRVKDFNQSLDDLQSWFLKVPGLTSEIELMAWSHRNQAPIIYVYASDADVGGSTIRVQMIPRSFWDEDPRFLDTFTVAAREGIQMRYGDELSFCSSTKYLSVLRYDKQGKQRSTFVTRAFRANGAVRAAEIVEALTAETKPEDLADAFAWFGNVLPAQLAQDFLQIIRNRATTVHGCTAPQGSVPIPTRALNNEVAYGIMKVLELAFDIRLTDLRSATHLNGREGVIRGPFPADKKRWTVRLDDGMYVSVKAANFLHVRRGDYRRVSASAVRGGGFAASGDVGALQLRHCHQLGSD